MHRAWVAAEKKEKRRRGQLNTKYLWESLVYSSHLYNYLDS